MYIERQLTVPMYCFRISDRLEDAVYGEEELLDPFLYEENGRVYLDCIYPCFTEEDGIAEVFNRVLVRLMDSLERTEWEVPDELLIR